MKIKIKPFRPKRMNRRMTLLLADELARVPKAPMEKLNADARWLENYILEKRSSSKKV